MEKALSHDKCYSVFIFYENVVVPQLKLSQLAVGWRGEISSS